MSIDCCLGANFPGGAGYYRGNILIINMKMV
jgi:hypothetical protein